eukprot:TRINITY_DN21472_c1_g2_i3.p1 TRINITY_DN21472_c1_g2~~TRINITY_DN21472_c1_g2_i3.p1  ORF type:complete len:117 (-),score=0.99 TRINITY_DN21472_c1_g2_i3:17-367(-)
MQLFEDTLQTLGAGQDVRESVVVHLLRQVTVPATTVQDSRMPVPMEEIFQQGTYIRIMVSHPLERKGALRVLGIPVSRARAVVVGAEAAHAPNENAPWSTSVAQLAGVAWRKHLQK